MTTAGAGLVFIEPDQRGVVITIGKGGILPDALEPAVLEDIIAVANLAEKKLRVLVRRVVEELP